MPREDRRIIFDSVEVYKAIYALSVQKEIRKPPPGVLESIVPDKDDPSKLKATITNPQEKDSTRVIEFSRDFLAAALLVFCRSQNIPVSKKARKSVEFSGSDVVLRLEI
ncbi:MAG: hypothetical protein KJ667_06245 [Alphaproteobacteria bacterium]|nr:hypothetical protein [Alphaproteobacteria bacterium]